MLVCRVAVVLLSEALDLFFSFPPACMWAPKNSGSIMKGRIEGIHVCVLTPCFVNQCLGKEIAHNTHALLFHFPFCFPQAFGQHMDDEEEGGHEGEEEAFLDVEVESADEEGEDDEELLDEDDLDGEDIDDEVASRGNAAVASKTPVRRRLKVCLYLCWGEGEYSWLYVPCLKALSFFLSLAVSTSGI